jgi:hypothetical protein
MKKLLLLALLVMGFYFSPLRSRWFGSPGSLHVASARAAADEFRASRAKPTALLLYATTCPSADSAFQPFADFASRADHAGARVLVFFTDDPADTMHIQPFLTAHHATFEARWIEPWAPGGLASAFRPLGIDIGGQQTCPFLAVRNSEGGIVYQARGARDVAAADNALRNVMMIRY